MNTLDTILNQPWDVAHYDKFSTAPPEIIGRISPALLDRPKEKLKDLHIRARGSQEYLIPEEITGRDELLAIVLQLAEHEKKVNPKIEEYHTYLSVSQSPVKKTEHQRRPGIHVDGLVSARYGEEFLPDRNYVICSAQPTIYHLGKFDTTGVDLAEHDLFLHLERCVQAAPQNFKTFRPAPYEICYMHAYHAHETAPAEEDHPQRTFIKLTYSQLIYDRNTNSRNPLIPTNWAWEDRPLTFELLKQQQKLNSEN